MQSRKRLWVVLSALAAFGMLISACDTAAQPTPTQVTTDSITPEPTSIGESTPGVAAASPMGSTDQGKLTGSIDFQVFGDPAELAVFQDVVKGFSELQPDAKVNIVHIPSQGEHMTKLSTSLAAGNPADVFLINYRRYGQFASKGVIEPVAPLLEKSTLIKEDMYWPQALDAFRYNGTLQCIPQNISSLVVYYNKDLFAKYGVSEPPADWNWDQFLAAAQTLTKDENGDGTFDVHGVGIEPQLIRVAPFVWANGGEIVDNPEKPTTLTLQTGPAREAVQFFMDLSLVHKVVPSEPEAKAEDIESRFMNGRLAMIFASRAATPSFREIEGFKWDVAPLPQKQQKASILHSDAYCIAAASKNKELAWRFVEYAQGPDGQTRAAKLGRTVPSLKSIAESPAFLDPSQSPANSQAFLDAIPNIKLVPVLSTWPQIENTVNEELERAFYAVAPLDTVLTKATEDTKKLFASANE
jgi:multiple sugar transport system substrate-binding protein